MKKENNHNSENVPNKEEMNNTANNSVEQTNNNQESLNINLLQQELEEKNKTIAELEAALQDQKDKLLRKAAEFENYKRRTENDQLNIIKYSAEGFIKKLLSVVDDFERSLEHIDKSTNIESLKEGISLIYGKFVKLLEEQEVKPIDAKGKKFDFNYHDAIMKQTAEGTEPETVLMEVEKGYLYKDKVIRHSKVIISE